MQELLNRVYGIFEQEQKIHVATVVSFPWIMSNCFKGSRGYTAQVLNPAKMSLLSGVAKLRQVLRSMRPRVAQQPPRMTLWSPNQGSE